jgi:hypothetical protein
VETGGGVSSPPVGSVGPMSDGVACASSGGHWEWPELRLPTRRRLVRPFGHRRGAPAGAQPANIALSRAAGGRVLLRDGDKGSVAVADDQVGVGRQGRVAVHRRADVDVEQCCPVGAESDDMAGLGAVVQVVVGIDDG